jgi:hypothetical protein
MFQSLRLVILTAAALVTSTLCAPDALAKPQEIRFKKGTKVTVVKGTWDGTTKTYVFRARKGQYMDLKLNEKDYAQNPLTFNLYSYCEKTADKTGKPELTDGVSYAAMLPCTEQYSLDIGAPAGSGVKGPIKFEIKLSID